MYPAAVIDKINELIAAEQIPTDSLIDLLDTYGDSPIDSEGNLRCPHCGSSEDFATIEDVTAAGLIGSITAADGQIEWLGDIRYGDSETRTDGNGQELINCRACDGAFVLTDNHRLVKRPGA